MARTGAWIGDLLELNIFLVLVSDFIFSGAPTMNVLPRYLVLLVEFSILRVEFEVRTLNVSLIGQLLNPALSNSCSYSSSDLPIEAILWLSGSLWTEPVWSKKVGGGLPWPYEPVSNISERCSIDT